MIYPNKRIPLVRRDCYLKRLNQYVKNRNYERTILYTKLGNLIYLKPGRYILLHIGKTVLCKPKDIRRILEVISRAYLSSKSNRVKLFLKILIGEVFKIDIPNNTAEEPNGDFVIITAKNNYKLFNFDRMQVSTYSTNEKFLHQEKTYEAIGKHFPSAIIAFDENKLIIVENLIYQVNEKQFVTRLIVVLNQYIDFFIKYAQSTKSFRTMSFQNRWGEDISKQVFNLLDERQVKIIEESEYPYLLGHGDFWANNVLLTANGWILIDWDHADVHVFFYDVFHFIIQFTQKNNNYALLDQVFNGALTDGLTSLFHVFEMVYNDDKILDYLLLATTDRIAKFLALGYEVDNAFLITLGNIEKQYL